MYHKSIVRNEKKQKKCNIFICLRVIEEDATVEAMAGYNYAGYLNFICPAVEYADYNQQMLQGEVRLPEEYNDYTNQESIPWDTDITSALRIEVHVGNYSDYTYSDYDGRFSLKFHNAAPGTPVIVNYTIGGAVKNEQLCVTKEVTARVICPNVTFDGKRHGPTKSNVTVKVGNETLSKSDFIIEDASSFIAVDSGYYSVCNSNTCKYRFEEEELFTIIPKGTTIKKLKKQRKAIKVTWKKQSTKMTRKHITGYKIQVATDKNFKYNKKTVKVKGYKKTTKTIKKLKAKKTYYVRIKTYIYQAGEDYDGYYYESKWSPVKKIKTK